QKPISRNLSAEPTLRGFLVDRIGDRQVLDAQAAAGAGAAAGVEGDVVALVAARAAQDDLAEATELVHDPGRRHLAVHVLRRQGPAGVPEGLLLHAAAA